MQKQPSTETPQYATLRPPCPEVPRRRRRTPKPIIIIPKPRYRKTENGERMLTVVTIGDDQHGTLPMIRMRGQWLAQLGFDIGTRIVVSEERGRIVLTLAPAE
jgi:hypothetical protein